jgi:hypothetical protein
MLRRVKKLQRIQALRKIRRNSIRGTVADVPAQTIASHLKTQAVCRNKQETTQFQSHIGCLVHRPDHTRPLQT